MSTNSDEKPIKHIETGLTLKLSHDNRTIMSIDAWYLILSAILRADPPFHLNKTLEESVLTGEITIGGEPHFFLIPKPPEFNAEDEK